MKNNERKSQIKELEGEVISNGMNNTVAVRVVYKVRHPLYGKIITRSKKYQVHSDKNVELGSIVRIKEGKKMSKLKSWIVI